VHELPSGTVTLLFTDIEGSTELLRRLGDRWPEAHALHRRVLREALGAAGGREVDTQGDSFLFVFRTVREAAKGALDGQRGLAAAEWPLGEGVRVRMSIHSGEPTVGEEGYLGLDVVRGARLCAAAHGGQIVLSETARALLGDEPPDGARLVDLGEHRLKDLPRPERVWQLGGDEAFPPLRTDAPEPLGSVVRADQLARQALMTRSELGERIKGEVFASLAQLGVQVEDADPARRSRSGSALVAAAVVAVLVLVSLVWLLVR
jgi:class 3 adenylate cyclase